MAGIAVVTDSTAYLPEALAAESGLTVVPITVVIGGRDGLEGIDISPSDVASALLARRVSVTTSRPSPAAFAVVYRKLLDQGADGIVSVHLSSKLSGTYDAAVLAALEVTGVAGGAARPDDIAVSGDISLSGDVGGSGPVAAPGHAARQAGSIGCIEVIDGQSAGMGLGFAALSGAAAARDGSDLAAVRDATNAAVSRTTALFYVDSLEFLRRGGRIGAAQALLGTALSVKPILHIVDGAIVVRDKVRTSSRAVARMVDLAVTAAGDGQVDVAVHHLGTPDRAEAVAATLSERLGGAIGSMHVTEIGAAVAAHVGPGLLSIVVHRR
jgi:DegV family protein with EDD domain